MTEWIMVAITSAYVAATIFICVFNYRSAKATKAQVAEAKRQFDEINRAYITIHMEIIRNGLPVLCIANHGKKLATDVQLRMNTDFFDAIPEDCRVHMEKLQEASFSLGIGQQLFSTITEPLTLNKLSGKELKIDLTYRDDENFYSSKFTIKFDEYFWSLIYHSPESDIYTELKKHSRSLEIISKKLTQ